MTLAIAPIQRFVIVFDRERDEQLQVLEFQEDLQGASREYRRLESQYRGRPEIDVLLAGASSLETLRKTHSTYFPGFSDSALQARLREFEATYGTSEA